eukprot:8191901-Pyramimonas_sp.AAC.1
MPATDWRAGADHLAPLPHPGRGQALLCAIVFLFLEAHERGSSSARGTEHSPASHTHTSLVKKRRLLNS